MPTMPHSTINQPTAFTLLGAGDEKRNIPVVLEYDTGFPYAVSVVFHNNAGTVRWQIARDVLVKGLLTRSGEGDFVIGPLPHNGLRLVISLSTPNGSAQIVAPALAIAGFLDRTTTLVPLGEEDMSEAVDEAVLNLLSGVE